MNNSTANSPDLLPIKSPQANGAQGTGLGAAEKESQGAYGPGIAQTALRSIGMSAKEIRGTNSGSPEYAAAVSIIFTKATNQAIRLVTPPQHVLSTAILWNSLVHDKRFRRVPMSEAAPGDIVIESGGHRAAGFVGVVVDHGRIVSMGKAGTVQNSCSLAEIQSNRPATAIFRYIGVQKYHISPLANAGFNLDEPRIPAGQPGGGQWTAGEIAPSSAIFSGRNSLLSDEFGLRDPGQKVVPAPAKASNSSRDALNGRKTDSYLAKMFQALEAGGPHPTPAQLEDIGEACDAWQRYVVSHGVSPFVAGEQIQNLIHNFYNRGSTPNPGSEAVLGLQQGQSAGAGAGSIIVGAVGGISGSRKSSVWSTGPGPRGLQIEARLGGNLQNGFPTVDRFENGVVTSIKSIDLNVTSYQNMRTLATTLENYTDKVANFNGAARGTVDIRSSDITGRQLQIAIPPGSMSTAQKTVFAAAATEAQIKGVTIIVTEIH